MNIALEQIVELERANYAAMLPVAEVTPGLDVLIKDDLIITSSEAFPAPDTTHACLLRATPQTADELIAEVRDHFQSRKLPTTVFVSPACTPADLIERLSQQGFVKQDMEEAWLVLEDLPNFEVPAAISGISVKPITSDEASTFASIFLTAFEMPVEFAPYMAQLLEPSIGLPGIHHYLALADEQPIGVCSLLCYERFGILGSAGVVPAQRKGGAATNLAVEAVSEAKARGVETLMLQTNAGTWLERLLLISGFKKAFVRTCYTLS